MMTSSKVHAMEGVLISESSLQSQVCMSLLDNLIFDVIIKNYLQNVGLEKVLKS